MIEFGETLRKAREAKGLSASEIANKTHLLAQQIDALEREDFSKIAAPIYGRGFVKLYCEALGLDPKPLIEAFMDIYTGNRQPTIKTRPPRTVPPPEPRAVTPEPAPAPRFPADPEPLAESSPVETALPVNETPVKVEPAVAPEPVPPPPVEPVSTERPSFSLEQQVVHTPPPRPARAFQENDFDAPPDRPRPLSRYSTPAPFDDKPPRIGIGSVPPAVWRILALGVAAIAVIWLLAAGVRAIYNASMTAPGENGDDSAEAVEPAVQPASAPAAGLTPPASTQEAPKRDREIQKIPPLYID